MSKKILILGASGFIGKHAVRKFLASGYNVFAQHLPTENPPNIPEASWFPCDLREQGFTKSFPQEVDTIIYLAQSPDWRSFPDGASDVFQVNVAAAFQTTEYARQAKAGRLIFASTGSIYGQHAAPIHEEDVRTEKVASFYAASKLATELLLNQYHIILPVINLRLFMPYGEGQHEKMLIPNLVNRVKDNIPIDLHGNDGLIINPIAGMGGRVGLKGTDGSNILDKALELGAIPQSELRTREALTVLRKSGTQLVLITYSGNMGENAARENGFSPDIIGSPAGKNTTSEDSISAAKAMLEAEVDLLLFAGGDGTARDHDGGRGRPPADRVRPAVELLPPPSGSAG